MKLLCSHNCRGFCFRWDPNTDMNLVDEPQALSTPELAVFMASCPWHPLVPGHVSSPVRGSRSLSQCHFILIVSLWCILHDSECVLQTLISYFLLISEVSCQYVHSKLQNHNQVYRESRPDWYSQNMALEWGHGSLVSTNSQLPQRILGYGCLWSWWCK